MKILSHVTTAFIGVLLFNSQSFAAQKVALVIGNSEYNTVSDRLKNPANDAKAVASRLKNLGYDTELLLNANLSKMLTALNGLNGKVDAGGTVIVYYAGHGIQLSGHNYLVPVDAGMTNRDMVTRETIQLQEVIDKLESSGAANRLVILDACRNDPFPKAFRSGTRGLTREQLTTGNGMMVMYAASPSEVAADGQGQHGTFTQALLQGFNQSGVKLPEMMDDIREQVRRDTKGTQNPYYEGTGLSRFVLVPAAPVVNTVTPVADSDKQFWDEIKSSTDASEYQAYLTQYPNGKFAALAQSRKDKYTVKPAQPSTSKLDTLRLEREQAPNSTSIYDSLTLKPNRENDNNMVSNGRYLKWTWPITGILSQSTETSPNKNGVDISGERGSPVKAAADGVIVYAGTGIVGYGNLIVIRHDDNFLSAYANNERLTKSEGLKVKAGEVIALIGTSGETKDNMLHFEIRYRGKPVDPLLFLPSASETKPPVDPF
ncbi:MAG: caspase family protein [Pseudomonadales bacterium]|nr:caspase family protein [Pseudomonadales bacterium]